METKLIKKGIKYLFRGEFKRVIRQSVKHAASHFPSSHIPIKFDKKIIPNSFKIVTEIILPDWLQQSKGIMYQINEGLYMTSIQDHSNGISISASQEFDSVEIPVIKPELSNLISFTSNLEKRELVIDTSFDYESALWVQVKTEATDSTSIDATIDANRMSNIGPGLIDFIYENKESASTKIGQPAIVPTCHSPPILIISIDSLRYDQGNQLASIIEEMGDYAVVPAEPRTQGTWTPPSHASMFTGTHPGEHGYVGYNEGPDRPIHPDLLTFPSILAEEGYKNSALVSHPRLLPRYGFGRGFNRFVHARMQYSDWVTRANDSQQSVNQVIRWMTEDHNNRSHSLSYFLHIFDLHFPYVPPLYLLQESSIDLSIPKRYKQAFRSAQGKRIDYLERYNSNPRIPENITELMKRYYRISVSYVANQIARLLRHMKSVGLFDEALIIIVGDHGEEWGERGFFTHTSLYDDNIRPFMIVKPPKNCDWPVRDAVDTIDFLPTIAYMLDVDIPEYCTGTPLQCGTIPNRIRKTERIYPDSYNIAIEQNGIKGIFTYPSNHPDRPEPNTVNSGPINSEFYRIENVRAGTYKEADIAPNISEKMLSHAESFITKPIMEYNSFGGVANLSKEKREQLKMLGYV